MFYGAVSLDGYLARRNHDLDWLYASDHGGELTYDEFFETIGTILMGRKTYDMIMKEIQKDGSPFPYHGRPCYVFSRSRTGATPDVRFVGDDVVRFTQGLKDQGGGSIWIVGGGEVLSPLLHADLVDEFIIQVAPFIIGDGIPLFTPGDFDIRLQLTDVRRYKQMAELRYARP